jgi:hypothetical protein
MESRVARLGKHWCRVMHPSPRWPIHGHYQCPLCLRTYPVPWEQPEVKISSPATTGATQRRMVPRSETHQFIRRHHWLSFTPVDVEEPETRRSLRSALNVRTPC